MATCGIKNLAIFHGDVSFDPRAQLPDDVIYQPRRRPVRAELHTRGSVNQRAFGKESQSFGADCAAMAKAVLG